MQSTSSSSARNGQPVSHAQIPSTSAKQRRGDLDETSSDNSDDEDDDDDVLESEEEAWEDWVDNEQDVEQAPTQSLFDADAKLLPGPEAALAYDREHSGCDIVEVVARLCEYKSDAVTDELC